MYPSTHKYLPRPLDVPPNPVTNIPNQVKINEKHLEETLWIKVLV